MEKTEQIRELLTKIESSATGERAGYIAELQEKIWDEPAIANEALQQVLADLAYDLNFYERDEQHRDETLGYYGDARLSEIIATAIGKTEAFLQSTH